jgi:hypothetical protein
MLTLEIFDPDCNTVLQVVDCEDRNLDEVLAEVSAAILKYKGMIESS